jgi:hypothetical protein
MARYRRYRRRPRPSTRALTVKLSVLAIVATLFIGGLIAVQMSAGDDPALGPKAAKAKKSSAASTSTGPSTGTSASSTAPDPYSQAYGYPSSGYSTQHSSPAPVTSSTS